MEFGQESKMQSSEVATSIKPVKELIEPNFTPEDVPLLIFVRRSITELS